MLRGAKYNTSAALEEALLEGQATVSTKGWTPTVTLNPRMIKTVPALFQPREFSFGLRRTDKKHVEALRRALRTEDKLNPIMVIKLGRRWVCVDGHHRIDAYIAEDRSEIECAWFKGTVQEALRESMRLNKEVRLNVPQKDRLERAWKYVVLRIGSKAEIVRECTVSDGTVGHMRRVLNGCLFALKNKTNETKRLREALKEHGVTTQSALKEKTCRC